MSNYNPYYYQVFDKQGNLIGINRRKKGDFDGCGKISSKDIILFYYIYKNQDNPKYQQYLPVADMNDDGVIDKKDVDLFEKIIKRR